MGYSIVRWQQKPLRMTSSAHQVWTQGKVYSDQESPATRATVPLLDQMCFLRTYRTVYGGGDRGACVTLSTLYRPKGCIRKNGILIEEIARGYFFKCISSYVCFRRASEPRVWNWERNDSVIVLYYRTMGAIFLNACQRWSWRRNTLRVFFSLPQVCFFCRVSTLNHVDFGSWMMSHANYSFGINQVIPCVNVTNNERKRCGYFFSWKVVPPANIYGLSFSLTGSLGITQFDSAEYRW